MKRGEKDVLKQTKCDVVVSATHVCFGCDVPPCKEKRREEKVRMMLLLLKIMLQKEKRKTIKVAVITYFVLC